MLPVTDDSSSAGPSSADGSAGKTRPAGRNAVSAAFSVGSRSKMPTDEPSDPEHEHRLATIEKALVARKDLTGQVSVQQLARLKQFEAHQEAQMRAKKLKWYIIDPHSQFMQWWDTLTAVALVFTALVTPLEVAFLDAPECPDESLFVINRIIDGIFLFDMSLQFFLSHPIMSGRWETKMKVIAARYLQGWFIVDVLSIFPSIFDIIPVLDCGVAPDPSGATGKNPMTTLRVIRALRLLKLVRLFRTPFALIKRLVVRIATPRATITVISLLVECLFVAHSEYCRARHHRSQ